MIKRWTYLEEESSTMQNDDSNPNGSQPLFQGTQVKSSPVMPRDMLINKRDRLQAQGLLKIAANLQLIGERRYPGQMPPMPVQ
ncbi:hypothetical protein HXX01_04815 [Candidatus Nomurabacteria bacterium]|nr:hypothetical protein [Candidatus Nomurabacteria bacterium]